MGKVPDLLPSQLAPIVLVDDEAELVHAISAMLRVEFGDGCVRATCDARQALAWVKLEKPGVLITDLRMPDLSGLDLVAQTQQMWGPTPTIVITAFPTEAVSAGARRGSFLYLPKPFSFRSLAEAVRRLEDSPPASFSGAIAVSTLADLLQLYAISGSTGLMLVRSGERRGEIWFERGQVIHARSGEAQGFEAFRSILVWRGGSFSWQSQRTEQRTIQASISELMLEAYRIHDEEAREPDEPRASLPTASADAPRRPTRPPPDAGAASLARLERLDGFLGAALVDSDSGAVLGLIDGKGALDLGIASAGNTEVVRAKRKTVASLGLRDDIEDMLITLGEQYHLIRPLRSRPGVFFYLAVDRARASLAMARMTLADAEKNMTL